MSFALREANFDFEKQKRNVDSHVQQKVVLPGFWTPKQNKT